MKKVAKKKSKENINYFGFIAVLIAGICLTIKIPDSDLNVLSMLSHRSIITHSILFPFLMHFFLINKKENPNPYLAIFIIGFYVAIAMHLSADMHPKGWRGTAFIKLPGNSSIGEVPSFIWMGLNTITAIYFSTILLKKIVNTNKIINTKKYFISFLVLALLIGLIYTVNDKPAGREMEKLSTFAILLLGTFFSSIRKSTTGNLINFSGLKKLFKIILWLILAGIVVVIIAVFVESNNEKKIEKQKEINWRITKVYQDEIKICSNSIKNRFNKKKFNNIKYVSFFAPNDINQMKFIKKIKLKMYVDGLILKNKPFGTIVCNIQVYSNQKITFSSLTDRQR